MLPSAKSCARRVERFAAEVAIGRLVIGPFGAAIHDVEQDGGGHDRAGHRLLAESEADTALRQFDGDARCRIEAEDRAARQHDRMHMLDQIGGFEHRRLAAAGRAAADLDGGDRGLIGQDHRGAGERQPVLGIADR